MGRTSTPDLFWVLVLQLVSTSSRTGSRSNSTLALKMSSSVGSAGKNRFRRTDRSITGRENDGRVSTSPGARPILMMGAPGPTGDGTVDGRCVPFMASVADTK